MPTTLKDYRRRAGLTQTALAARLGKHRSLISLYESGHIDMPISMARALAVIFDVPLVELLEALPDAKAPEVSHA